MQVEDVGNKILAGIPSHALMILATLFWDLYTIVPKSCSLRRRLNFRQVN